MGIAYVTFVKHAQKVTKTASASRPILKGVHHAEDGTLVVTDSRRLYLAKNAHANTLGEIIDPKTGAVIDGQYPDVSRLIPDANDSKYTAVLPVKETVDAFAALLKTNHSHDKKRDIMTEVEVSASEIIFSVKNRLMCAEFTPGVSVDGNGDKMTFNTQYFADALALFKEAGIIEVTMRYYGSFRPFTLSADSDDLLTLILPIRRAVD